MVFVTTDREFGQLVGLEKERILPQDANSKLTVTPPASFTVFSFIKSQADLPEDLTKFLVSSSLGHDGVMLMVEAGLEGFVSQNRDAAFTWFFESRKARLNPHNYLSAVLSRALRVYSAVIKRFEDMKSRQPMLLPMRNFLAGDLSRMRNSFHANPMPTDIVDTVDRCIKGLRATQSPKKSSTYNDVYYIDENDRYYQYGHEEHARPETSVPPHGYYCLLNSNFRFGVSYDAIRHFNVSEAKKNQLVKGSFYNCHDQATSPPKSALHMNMFPSDQIA
ncbi:hypothetical protein [Brevundimonas sp. SL161]|uniref:hypothetical protein n=1 Tax=Brevundimonas sp. SL161 TaxID=2804613 RepID=UPI003CF637D5